MRAGELCAGYGGLALAVEEVFGAKTAWFSEFDPAPSKILAHHWPDIPNHGDMTKIDWAAIEPVDIISGGTPCQDISGAGKRKGMVDGTRSNLWVHMREAIASQRPKFVIWENVRGAFSAEASCDLEQCEGCVGDPSDGRVFLRALGRVLGDLSDLGYDARWETIRAADIGAPHGRSRVFILAANSELLRGSKGRHSTPGQEALRGASSEPFGRGRTPTLAHASRLGLETRRLPSRPSTQESEHNNSVGVFREYSAAVTRWEQLTRPAPKPTVLRPGGKRPTLNIPFVEWMMGLPDGWVTDPDLKLTRGDQLKALGNGVVPQQAAAALRDMLGAFQQQWRLAA